MKLVKPSFEIWEELPFEEAIDNGVHVKRLANKALGEQPSREALVQAVYRQIEKVGRVCYKSEDKITDDSAKPFVDRMIASQHYAMLEHGTVYLKIPYNLLHRVTHIGLCSKYVNNPYSYVDAYYEYCDYPLPTLDSRVNICEYLAVTTNLRVLVENEWLDDLKYICAPTEHHIKRVTVHFVCNRQVSHEYVRHRVFSFAQESTRYCNYTKGKFGNELAFIDPCWCTKGAHFNPTINSDMEPEDILKTELQLIELAYKHIIEGGWQPQQAATLLPNALKTELCMTGTIKDWMHFFDLRAKGTTGKPHPQAQELALPLMEEFEKRRYIEDKNPSNNRCR